MLRLTSILLFALSVAACTNPNDLDEAPVHLGNFHLGHNVVVAPNLTKGPASRDASREEWIAVMKSAIDERFGRYDGTRLYHLGISVEGYVLAIPGIPLVAAPKSALILKVTAWDDAKQGKLNPEPETITVVESISGKTVLSSGLTQSKETQMDNLSRNAAKQIQNWLERMNEQNGWFEDDGSPVAEKPVDAPPVQRPVQRPAQISEAGTAGLSDENHEPSERDAEDALDAAGENSSALTDPDSMPPAEE